MPNLLTRGLDFLIRSMEGAAAVTGGVTYTRGAESVTLSAWVGRTVFNRNQQETGAAIIFGERDYLFRAADLVIGASVTVPRKGDRITETINGQPLVFEVMPPEGDEPVWRYSDQIRQVIRVHVKRVVTPT